ncbi:hypothetical protein HPB48_026010 [Haemaphysalis longicornis]|uniref:Uncharacterized protein n=1 Tax=Haemaphysalis longicornis TaxID=44386 RepID=A0A9J6H8I7_HAELO|nr:hypothetical protein HPB48_026010 [Haemaphysalis longicornis]
MGYFDEGSTLPPPFNIIISPKSVWYFLRGLLRLCRFLCKSAFAARPRFQHSAAVKVPLLFLFCLRDGRLCCFVRAPP